MKKLFSLLLALSLVLALGVTAFADDTLTGAGSGSVDVSADYTAASNNTADILSGAAGTKIYSINIAWTEDSNNIVYNGGTTTYAWSTANQKYEVSTSDVGKGWTGTAAYTITVTNYSNASVGASAAWSTQNGVTVSASVGADITVGSAAAGITTAAGITGGASGSAQSDTIAVSVATPTAGEISADDTPIGKITVTITL